MPVDEKLLVVVRSDMMGDGEPDLGHKLMQSFLGQLQESGHLPAKMLFMNSGVFLTTKGSPALDTLRSMETRGTVIKSCGTCLAYYDRADQLMVGQAGNMKETVSDLLSYEKIISP